MRGGEVPGESLGPDGGLRHEPDGQLAHDRQQLGLDFRLEVAVDLERLRDEIEQPLGRPIEPSDDGRVRLGGVTGGRRGARSILSRPSPLDEIDDPAHEDDGKDAL